MPLHLDLLPYALSEWYEKDIKQQQTNTSDWNENLQEKDNERALATFQNTLDSLVFFGSSLR